MRYNIMNEELAIKAPYTMENQDRKTFEFSRKKDGVNINVRGRKVENGWVVSIDKNWKDGEEYKYDSKEYISVKSPLDKVLKKPEKKKDDGSMDIGSIVSGMMGESNAIIVE